MKALLTNTWVYDHIFWAFSMENGSYGRLGWNESNIVSDDAGINHWSNDLCIAQNWSTLLDSLGGDIASWLIDIVKCVTVVDIPTSPNWDQRDWLHRISFGVCSTYIQSITKPERMKQWFSSELNILDGRPSEKLFFLINYTSYPCIFIYIYIHICIHIYILYIYMYNWGWSIWNIRYILCTMIEAWWLWIFK